MPASDSSPGTPVDLLFALLPPAITTLHAVLAPYTKVEESFTLHALHDFLYRGFQPTPLWDHVEFPGPLPRSFVPALLLSVATRPVLAVLQALGIHLSKFDAQILARVVLGLLSSASLALVARQVLARYGTAAQRLYILLSVTQFHIPYYSSRTLPNFMALPVVNLVLALILNVDRRTVAASRSLSRDGLALALLAATTTIVRSELACLLGPLALALICKRRVTPLEAIKWGALGGFGGTAVTILVDSYYWGFWTWPEAHGVWFNVYLNESSKQWGTSPWWYYLKHLPLLLLASGPLSILAVGTRAVRRRVEWSIGILSPLAMVAAMSVLGHKEWRFVAYVVSWLNVPAAVMAAHLWQSSLRPSPVLLRFLLRTLVLGLLAGNTLAATVLLGISRGNYPGGQIMRGALREELRHLRGQPVHLYSPSLPLQTGSTLFLAPPHPLWTYNKTELAHELDPAFALDQEWTHVVLPSGKDDEVRAWTGADGGWEEVGRASGFGGLAVMKGAPKGGDEGLWVSLGGDEGFGAGLGAHGVRVRTREGERCVLVRRHQPGSTSVS